MMEVHVSSVKHQAMKEDARRAQKEHKKTNFGIEFICNFSADENDGYSVGIYNM